MLVTMVALALPCDGTLTAGEAYRLETNVYVCGPTDFQSIKLPVTAKADGNGGVVVRSPAAIEFDKEKLSLAGAEYSWSGGKNPPGRFSRIEVPAVVLEPGNPVSLLSALSVQYLEKAADGSLHVREIAKDSPEAPHWRLTFTLGTTADSGDDLSLACDVDIASIGARESLPGVTLPVGKPVLARFNERLALKVPPQQWSAFVVRAPTGSDYTLLTLLKIVPEPTPGETSKAGRLMTAQEFARFATYYYQHPHPEQIARAIESLGPSRFFDLLEGNSKDARIGGYVFVGFFAEVFAANPKRLGEWRTVIDQRVEDRHARSWLHKALKLSLPGAILALKPDGFGEPSEFSTYVCWGAFFASGKPAYLQQLVDRLRLVRGPFDAGAEAMLSLAFHTRYHPLVRQILEATRKKADPRTRKLIDDVLTKDLVAVRQELKGVHGTDDDHTVPLPEPGFYLQRGIPLPPVSTPQDPWAGFYGRHDGS